MKPVSSCFLYLSITDPQRFGIDRAEQEVLLKRLKPVETGYHRDLYCMDGTRQSLLNQVMEWVANKPAQENILQSNAYWFSAHPESEKRR